MVIRGYKFRFKKPPPGNLNLHAYVLYHHFPQNGHHFNLSGEIAIYACYGVTPGTTDGGENGPLFCLFRHSNDLIPRATKGGDDAVIYRRIRPSPHTSTGWPRTEPTARSGELLEAGRHCSGPKRRVRHFQAVRFRENLVGRPVGQDSPGQLPFSHWIAGQDCLGHRL